MATSNVFDIRQMGTTFVLDTIPITEKLTGTPWFQSYLERFGEHYDLSNNSHLYRFLAALCGEVGAGSLRKKLLGARLSSTLGSTHFSDLDLLYGGPMRLPRLSSELYELNDDGNAVDPLNHSLTNSQWQDVHIKDSLYRNRCQLWMKAIALGPTTEGLAMAAEAACGVPCDIFEQYRYIDNASVDTLVPISMLNIGQTSSWNEFIIIPQAPDLTEEEKHSIVTHIDMLRPINSIPTIFVGEDAKFKRTVQVVEASTEGYQVKKMVTGRTDVDWPDIDPDRGLWISTDPKEAPTYAFMDPQEIIHYLTIVHASASSEHLGPFNRNQQDLFAHLRKFKSTDDFPADASFAHVFAPIQIATSWGSDNALVANNHYPLEYFSIANTEGFATPDPTRFWASRESVPPAVEELIFDLGSAHLVNFIDFGICQKPIDITIQYSVDGTIWEDVSPSPQFEATMSVPYLPSDVSPWHYFELHFDQVSAHYVKVKLARRSDPFPFHTSNDFPWSIEVRYLRLENVITNIDQIGDTNGVDILGNTFTTEVVSHPATNAVDGDVSTYWQSQPNPDGMAVECLYFDLSTERIPATMGFYDDPDEDDDAPDGIAMVDIDLQDMANVDTRIGIGSHVDEIYLDPLTPGMNMSVYYSDDDESDWDSKLWTPIPRQFVVRKGYHTLPFTVKAKYFKLEFTNLTPYPYQLSPHVKLLTRYRRFPSWVQDYFTSSYLSKPESRPSIGARDVVIIDPLELGFRKAEDQLNQQKQRELRLSETNTDNEIADFISSLVATQDNSESSDAIEAQIRYYPPHMYQDDLVSILDNTRTLSRFIQQDSDSGWNAESPPTPNTAPDTQSVPDQSEVAQRLQTPHMWFPIRARHGYQVVETVRNNGLVFMAALREAGFYRRDYTQAIDEEFYINSLDDAPHIEENEFIAEDWQYIVQP